MISGDLSAFFNHADGLVVPAILDLGATFYVHFDASYIDALGVASSSPAVTCQSSDVESAVAGSSILSVGGVDYRVSAVEPDSAGITVLRLHRA